MSGLLQVGCRVFQATLSEKNKIVVEEMVWVGITEQGESRKCVLARPLKNGGYNPSGMRVVSYDGVGPSGWTAPETYARQVISGSIKSEIQRRKDEIKALEEQLETTND